MPVVADTSPLNYLILIGEIELLPKLYQRILIPSVVLDELRHAAAPPVVVDWALTLPAWVDVGGFAVEVFDLGLADLDLGESAAITIAQANKSSVLLMDEALGRAEAARRNIATIGTLGILRDAATLGFVDLESVFTRLLNTSFRAPVLLMVDLLARDAERRKSGG